MIEDTGADQIAGLKQIIDRYRTEIQCWREADLYCDLLEYLAEEDTDGHGEGLRECIRMASDANADIANSDSCSNDSCFQGAKMTEKEQQAVNAWSDSLFAPPAPGERYAFIHGYRAAMNDHAKLREVLQSIVMIAPPMDCQDFHHGKADYHEGYNCPIEKRWNAAIAAARAALSKGTSNE